MMLFTLLWALAALPFSLGQVSDDFENGWDKSVWPQLKLGCDQGGTIALDSTTAHSGKNSMKVTAGTSGFCGHVFFGTTKVPPGGDVYVRVYLKAQKALTQNHVSFIIMPDTGLGSNKHLRIGGQDSVLTYNRESDDAVLPDLSTQGVATSMALTANAWQCFEYHVKTDGTIETWLDSKVIPGLTLGPGLTNTHASIWGKTYKPQVTGVYFGWEAYGGGDNTFWFDDISISATRPGCMAA